MSKCDDDDDDDVVFQKLCPTSSSRVDDGFVNSSPSRPTTSRVLSLPIHVVRNMSLANCQRCHRRCLSTVFGPFDRIPKLPVDVLWRASSRD